MKLGTLPALLVIYHGFFFSPAWAAEVITQAVVGDSNAIYRRYLGLFTLDQLDFIRQHNLGPTILELMSHKKLKVERNQELIDFALEITESGLTLRELESRLIRYTAKEIPIFTALRRAIKREHFSRWKTRRHLAVIKDDGLFMNTINQLALTKDEREKVVNTFAICIDSFTRADNRAKMQPSMCEPIDEYKTPRHSKHRVHVKEKKSTAESPRNLSYLALVAAAQDVAQRSSLNVFEKVAMAKCVAEQSLRFFEPASHLFTALRKTCAMDWLAPHEAFFMESGVCGNFAGIAYNFANELGLRNQIFLTKNGFHIYLEFTDGMNWYHTHPLNTASSCDITKFEAKTKS